MFNPNSRAVFVVLWLYSIEPPFYFYLNKACRRRDPTYLPMFGPFAAALFMVLRGAEKYRGDKLQSGKELYLINRDLGCF